MEKLLNDKRILSEETQQVRVDDISILTQALVESFIGIDLIRSQDRGNRHNLITFKKLKQFIGS